MKIALSPLFTDVTWGAGGSTADLSLELALYAHKTGHLSNMHLSKFFALAPAIIPEISNIVVDALHYLHITRSKYSIKICNDIVFKIFDDTIFKISMTSYCWCFCVIQQLAPIWRKMAIPS